MTSMYFWFYGATAFNNGGAPLVTTTNGWNTSHVTSMFGMLDGASAFNQSMCKWAVGNVTTIGLSATALSIANYDATLNGWDNQKVTISGDTLSSVSTTPTIASATISGSASVGSTLSAVAGTVTGNPTLWPPTSGISGPIPSLEPRVSPTW